MPTQKHDVIVVGGGLAGLTAARELHRAGLDVLVLEGRDRLGGRAYTGHGVLGDVELGGAFVHWFQPHIFAELTRYGLSARVLPVPARWSYLSAGRTYDRPTLEVAAQLQEAFDRLYADARTVLPLPHRPLANAEGVAAVDHQSVQDRIDDSGLDAEERDMVNAVLSTSCSARCSESALTAMMREFALAGWSFGLMMDTLGAASLRTAGLIRAIAAEAGPMVRLAAAVTTVEQDGHQVAVATRDGTRFVAEAAVVAVPLDTLGTLRFEPALDAAKQAALSEGHAGRGVKLWARVGGLDEPVFTMAPDDQPLTFVVTEQVLDGGTQLVVAFGPDAQQLAPGDEDAVGGAFAAMLPPRARLGSVTGHDWCTDEFSRGTWSSFRPGQLASLSELQAPHGRVAFAGSDIANGWNGFMDGAIESGLSSAHWVSHLLGPD